MQFKVRLTLNLFLSLLHLESLFPGFWFCTKEEKEEEEVREEVLVFCFMLMHTHTCTWRLDSDGGCVLLCVWCACVSLRVLVFSTSKNPQILISRFSEKLLSHRCFSSSSSPPPLFVFLPCTAPFLSSPRLLSSLCICSPLSPRMLVSLFRQPLLWLVSWLR